MDANQFGHNRLGPTESCGGQAELGADFEDLFAELQAFELGMCPTSPKRPRRTYDETELAKLETVFAANSYPDRGHRNALATDMHVSPKNIQIWFQNRRARERLLRRKAEGVVENPINRMRVQLAQSPHMPNPRYSAINKENQKPEVMGQSCTHYPEQGQDRYPPSSIINVQKVLLETSDHQSHQQPFFDQESTDDSSNSQETLPLVWQQESGPCSKPGAIHTAAVAPGRLRVSSVRSISNLSEISNSSFSDLMASTDSIDDPCLANLSPSYDFVFDF